MWNSSFRVVWLVLVFCCCCVASESQATPTFAQVFSQKRSWLLTGAPLRQVRASVYDSFGARGGAQTRPELGVLRQAAHGTLAPLVTIALMNFMTLVYEGVSLFVQRGNFGWGLAGIVLGGLGIGLSLGMLYGLNENRVIAGLVPAFAVTQVAFLLQGIANVVSSYNARKGSAFWGGAQILFGSLGFAAMVGLWIADEGRTWFAWLPMALAQIIIVVKGIQHLLPRKKDGLELSILPQFGPSGGDAVGFQGGISVFGRF